MKKTNKSAKDLRLSIILDKLCDLGWEYTCNYDSLRYANL